ncbi:MULTISPECIES: hypothetical protein [unclassified Mesorhizobium]|uniref:hypothetical protein n=1 Tax=unclassified Mesorhizobium TaxID=325217 RepID=UPI0019283F2F|nr:MULTISPECIES: hypothetical protein [unclassified Mesorhizobium]
MNIRDEIAAQIETGLDRGQVAKDHLRAEIGDVAFGDLGFGICDPLRLRLNSRRRHSD